MATKVTTVIVNQTKYVLIINVGTHGLASLKAGGEYKIQVDVNWTFQEFVLEVENTDHNAMKLTVNSDDCCDYRCITVTEVDGKLDVVREPRQQGAGANSQAVVRGGGYLKMESKFEWHTQLAGKGKLEDMVMGEPRFSTLTYINRVAFQ